MVWSAAEELPSATVKKWALSMPSPKSAVTSSTFTPVQGLNTRTPDGDGDELFKPQQERKKEKRKEKASIVVDNK